MPNIKDLLAPEAVAALSSVVEVAPVNGEAVHTHELSPTTTINGVEVDLRGDAMHETPCADCGTPLLVDISVDHIPDEERDTPRVAVCSPCAKARCEGRQGTVIRRAQTKKHPWRVVDEIDHPITVTTKEQNMPEIDLDQYSPAELAALVRMAQDRMAAKAAADLPAKRDKAVKKAKKAEAEAKEAKVADRATRTTLPGFTVKGVLVPALDLTDVANMDETLAAKDRSPYNKALYRLGLPLLEAEKATYALVVDVHAMLAETVEAKAAPVAEPVVEPKPKKAKKEAKKAKKAKASAPKLVAVLDEGQQAKVAALVTVLGITEAEARDRLARI